MADAMIQKQVTFYGDEIIAVQEPNGVIYVPVGRLCDNLGIQRRNQMDRLRDHEVLSQGIASVTIHTDGGPQATECLRLDLIPLWLTTINAKRVNEDVRVKLVRYQVEAASVLWDAFKQEILPTAQPTALVPTERSGAEIAYEMATAIQHLARQQMDLEQAQQQLGERMQGMARWGKQTDDRLTSLELSLHEGNFIPIAKATELSERVKALATLMTERGTKDNHYQGVFAELYRRFGVSSYKTLTNEQYAAVMAFLEQWRAAIMSGSEEPPVARG